MSDYIILSDSTANIGGAQKYLYNKIKYLAGRGYTPALIVFNKKNSLLKFKCDVICCSELKFPPYSYTRRRVDKVCDALIEEAKMEKGAVLETLTRTHAMWGEAIAEKINGKNFYFSIEEFYSIHNDGVRRFFRFKYDRGEMAGILDNMAMRIFPGENPGYYRDIKLTAAEGSPVENVPCPASVMDVCREADIVIGSIGRTNKRITRVLLKEIPEYAKKHGRLKFALVFIGGPKMKGLGRLAKKMPENLKAVDTGFIYPIPEELVRALNVNISTAGSVRAAAAYGTPSISTDVETTEAIGIYNYDTMNPLHADKSKKAELPVLLDRILFEDYCGKHEKIIPLEELAHYEIDAYFDRHIEAVAKSDASKKYYDTASIKGCAYERMFGLALRVLPAGICSVIYKFGSEIKQKYDFIRQKTNKRSG